MNTRILNLIKETTSKYSIRAFNNPRFALNAKIRQKKLLGVSMATLMLYTTYHFQPAKTKIKIEYNENSIHSEIVSKLSHLYNQHFRPNFFLAFPLLQFAMLKRPPAGEIEYQREYLRTPDGGQVALDWTLPKKLVSKDSSDESKDIYESYEPRDETKILFTLHGLTGGSESGYIKMMVEQANRNGYRTVVLNHRGINQPLLTPKPYHGGSLEEIEQALDYVRNKYPDAPIYIVGLSLGGNQLIRYLGTGKNTKNFVAAAGLAVPYDIEDCLRAIENTVYEVFFLKRYLQMNVLPHLEVFKSLEFTHGINIEEVLKVKKLREFHDKFTSKVLGHKDASDLFSTTKIKEEHIKNISIPLFLMHSRDDPIAVHKLVPVDWLKANPNIIYAETGHGAHLCWFSGINPRRWYTEPTLQFMDLVTGHMGNMNKIKNWSPEDKQDYISL